MTPSDITELFKLPAEEKLDLIEALWDSLEEGKVPVPDWHLAELDRRLAAHKDDPLAGEPWPAVRARLLTGLKS